MDTSERAPATRRGRGTRETEPRGSNRALAWFGGGTNGNEQLTAIAGVILLVLLPLLGITIVRIGQLIWEHLFLGLLLIGPVALKMASTGYRFVRYYTGNAEYRRKGPPELILRVIGPVVVLSTAVVLATGVMLLIVGPPHRDPWLLLHKVSFIVWLVFIGLHILGHLPAVGRALGVGPRGRQQRARAAPGAAGRWIVLVGALVAGLVLAIVLIPDFSAWSSHGAFVHHHRG